MEFFLPSSWRHRQAPNDYQQSLASDEGLFEEEEGERLVGFDVNDTRRGALEHGNNSADTERRLSRDLEEGFRDDSEDEDTVNDSTRHSARA